MGKIGLLRIQMDYNREWQLENLCQKEDPGKKDRINLDYGLNRKKCLDIDQDLIQIIQKKKLTDSISIEGQKMLYSRLYFGYISW